MSGPRRLLLGTAVAAGVLAVAVVLAIQLHHGRRLALVELEDAAERMRARTEDLVARAAAFDAGAALASLPANPRNGEYFLLDAQLEQARISPPAVASESAPAPTGFEFDSAESAGLVPVDGDWHVEDGVLQLEHRPGGYLMAPLELGAGSDVIAEIEVRMRLREGRRATLAWSRRRLSAWPEDEGRIDQIVLDVEPGDAFQVYRVNAEHSLRLPPGRKLRTVFLIPSDVEGDRVEIDYVRFVRKRDQYASPPVGRAYETRGRELRPVVYAGTPRELTWEVRVPRDDPRLDLGLAVLAQADPVHFHVTVQDAEARTRVLTYEVDLADRWHDFTLDLTAWAGQPVSISLGAESLGGNVAFWGSPRLSGAPDEPFHVLFVVEDTLRADYLSAYGHPLDTAPAKARLAERGVLFEYAFSQATKTRPSVPSYMTGLYPTTTGVWQHPDHLDERILTLAEILRSQGFVTASFLQNTNAGPAAGLHQGFGSVRGQRVMGTRPEEIYGDRVLRWIESNRQRNWFVYLHVLDPHGVYDPPEPHDAWYRGREADAAVLEKDELLDPGSVEDPTQEGRRLRYAGEIRNNDARLEAFLRSLDELGVLDHTLIVMQSDHGEHLGERGLWEHHPPGFNSVLRVPLLMAHPGELPAGRRVQEPVELVDVAPTILELAGVPLEPLLLQGDSLLPLIRHPDAPWERLAVSEEVSSYKRHRAHRVRGSLWLGSQHVLRSRHADQRSVWLFDYRSDPGEETPLAIPGHALYERRILRLLREQKRANLALWRALVRGAPADVRLDPESREQLRSLGYVE
jgi:arylsulfatase A-like enzyme